VPEPAVSSASHTAWGYWRQHEPVGRVDHKWTPTAPPHPPSADSAAASTRRDVAAEGCAWVPERKIAIYGGDVYVHDQEAAEIDAAVQRLPIPRPFTMGGLAEAVSEREGRPVKLIGEQLGGTAPCGWLIRTKEVDYVCYPTNTSRLHQLHIVLHEIGHLVLRHPAAALSTFGQPPADPAAERAAEMFATSAARRIWRVQQTRDEEQASQGDDVAALGAVFDVLASAGDRR
jgi:hypothetical protein